MFNSGISSGNNPLSDAINTNRLHNEALDRYHNMFGGAQNNNNSNTYQRPSLVDARFEHLTQVMDQERQQAERLLSQAFHGGR